MIVEHNWITASASFADATKTGPNRRNAARSQHRISRGFVKDLIAFVYNLHILCQAHGTVGVRGAQLQPTPGNGIPSNVRMGTGMFVPPTGEDRRVPVLDDWVGAIYVPIWYLGIFIPLPARHRV